MAGRSVRAVAGAVALVTGTAVAVVAGGSGTAVAGELPAFTDCAQLRSWYADAALPTVGPYGLGSGYGVATEAIAAGADSTGGEAAGSGDAPAVQLPGPAPDAVGNGPTGTNVQEAGVDEPDLAKTDGEVLVVAEDRRLRVLDVTGDRAEPLSTLTLPATYAGELLLVGDRAVVLGTAEVPPPAQHPTPPPTPGGWPYQQVASLVVVDLTDPRAPVVERVEEFEGLVVSAREHGGVVRVVLAHQPQLAFPMPVEPTEVPGTGPAAAADTRADVPPSLLGGPDAGWQAAMAAATRRNREVVREADAQDWLPQRVERDATGAVTGRRPLLDCADVRHPRDPGGAGTLTVLTLDPGAGTTSTAAVAADGHVVYASTDRLYVATTRGGWFGGPLADRAPGGIRPVGGGGDVRTQVHAFDTTGPTTTRYVASGEVEGHVLGQWAFSEHEGFLRVATTRPGADGGVRPLMEPAPDAPVSDQPAGAPDRGDNVVTVLEERGDRLVPVGSVDGLGLGEQVQAVRWFGDLGVVVTFRQIDPLYTLDLSDPTAPRVRGELKVPGYSAYLHPLGDGLLLGVGQDAAPDGRVTGAQASTFDLRDLSAPSRVDTLGFGLNSYTDVEHDSRAFTYLPEQRLAVLPVSSYDGRAAVAAMRVGPSGALAEAGRWSAPAGRWVLRAVPVDGERLAVVLDGGRVELLRAADLTPL